MPQSLEDALRLTPGEHGLKLAARQREQGVALYPSIMPGLEGWAAKLGVALPSPR